MNKATFQKCFDKTASITYEVRVKEAQPSTNFIQKLSMEQRAKSVLNPISEIVENEDQPVESPLEDEEESQIELDVRSTSFKDSPIDLKRLSSEDDNTRSPINSTKQGASSSGSGRHSQYMGSSSSVKPIEQVFSQTVNLESLRDASFTET